MLTIGCSSSSPKLYTLSPSKAASEMSTARDCTGSADAAMSAHQEASSTSQHRAGTTAILINLMAIQLAASAAPSEPHHGNWQIEITACAKLGAA